MVIYIVYEVVITYNIILPCMITDSDILKVKPVLHFVFYFHQSEQLFIIQ